MNKPNAYDEVRASGDFTPINLGGHTCTIKQVSETTSKNGAPMIVVLWDFDLDDNQAGYFQNEYQNNEKEGKKWPFNGTSWIMVQDYQDKTKTSRKFKTFCRMVEKSNPGFAIQWGGDGWGRQFVGKSIGAIYGNEEDEYNGEYRMRARFKWFCDVKEALTASAPEAKYIENKPAAAAQPAMKQSMTAVNTDDLPF